MTLNKTGNVHVNITLRCTCITNVAVQKQKVLHILRMFVTFTIQYAKCICHIILPSVACLALQYLSTLSHK